LPANTKESHQIFVFWQTVQNWDLEEAPAEEKKNSVVTLSKYLSYILQLKILFDWLVLMFLIQGCRFRSRHYLIQFSWFYQTFQTIRFANILKGPQTYLSTYIPIRRLHYFTKRLRKNATRDYYLHYVCPSLSVRPPDSPFFRMEHFDSQGTCFHEIWYWLFFVNMSRKFKFHSNLTWITGTLLMTDKHFLYISLLFS